MRKRILILACVVMAFCVLVMLKTSKHEKDRLSESDESLTTRPSPSKTVANSQAPNAVRAVNSTSAVVSVPLLAADTNPGAASRIRGQILADWQTPIEFYGKVVDQNEHPVPDAKVNFHWVEIPTEQGNRTATTQSDEGGLFSLRGAMGPTLSVDVSKEGYYLSKTTPNGFRYGLGGDIFHPQAHHPVTFHLRKKGRGEDLLTSDNGIRSSLAARIPKDGSTVRIDLIQKQTAATGQLEISQNKPPWKEATEWSFRMSIPGGGFVENQDEFQFEPPNANFQQTVEYRFFKSETNWTSHVTKQFYIEFGEPRRYGWLRIESDLAQETIFLTYAINPSGSRNLEPK